MARTPSKKTAAAATGAPSPPSGTGGASKAGAAKPGSKTQPPAKKPASAGPPTQRALVVGVSGYPAPITKLPAVTADVRGVARVLASRHGTFPAGGVAVLVERQATRDQVLAALRNAFSKAKADDPVFVYLAGHGAVSGGAYYYVAYDSKVDRLPETAVPLAEIKRLFDRTASRRVFLWLDFCHSGGITERRGASGDDLSVITREIGVVQGHGKVIVAACTAAQSAYEDAAIGHGLFTHALLRGLRGEARSAHGEVTALSLYEFIDREVKDPRQQPTFFGRLTGRMVLAHYPAAGAAASPAKPPAKAPASPKAAKAAAARSVASSGNLMLIAGAFYATRSVTEGGDGKVTARIAPRSAQEESALRSLRPDRYSSKGVAVAFRDRAFDGRVEEVSFHSVGTRGVCEITIVPEERERSYIAEMGYNGLSKAQLAELRARTLLLDERPSAWDAARDSMLHQFVLRPLEEAGAKGGIFAALHEGWEGTQADFLRTARLQAIYILQSSGTCDEVQKLELGPVRAGKLAVRFRGRYVGGRYSGSEPHEIAFEGFCPV